MSIELQDISLDEVNHHLEQAHKLRSEALYDPFSHIGHSGAQAVTTARAVLGHFHLPNWVQLKQNLH